MGVTLVVSCLRCDGLLLAAANQKTRTCPHCNAKIDVTRAQKIASAANAFAASEILRALKSKRQSNRRKSHIL